MINVTGTFVTDSTQKRTLFNIKCFNGKVIKNHSAFPDERETVLLPGTHLKVKSSLRLSARLCIVDLEQIAAPVMAEVKVSPTPLATTATHAESAWGIFSNAISILWYDPTIHETQENADTKAKLYGLFHDDFMPFDKADDFVSFVRRRVDSQLVVIISGSVGRTIIPNIHDLTQLDSVIVYCMDKQGNEIWSKDFQKVT